MAAVARQSIKTFIDACDSGDENAVRAALGDPAFDPNALSESGFAGLHLAAWRGRTAVVRLLLGDKRTDGNVRSATDKGRYTPLHIAARVGHADVVAALLATNRVDVNAPSANTLTPLLLAAREGRAAVLRELLAAPDLDASARDPHGNTAFHLACDLHARQSLAEGSKKRPEDTEFLEARRLDFVKLLCGDDGRISLAAALNKDGRNGFHLACKSGAYTIVNYLLGERRLQNDGKIYQMFWAKDGAGDTGFLLACRNDRVDLALELLVTHTNQVECQERDQYGRTGLAIATRAGYTDLIEGLLLDPEGQLRQHQPDEADDTPFHHAVCSQKKPIIDLFLKPEVLGTFDINATNRAGERANEVGGDHLRRYIETKIIENRRSLFEKTVAGSAIQYFHDQPLGKGGQGAVFRGTLHERPVAVKVLLNLERSSQEERNQAIRVVQREARIWAAIPDHENVLRLEGFMIEAPEIMLASPVVATNMKLYLITIARAKDNFWDKARQLLLGICRGMDAIHSASVAHGDLKPENVLVDLDSREFPIAKIADFGMSRIRVDDRTLTSVTSNNSTNEGTMRYAAPETLGGIVLGRRAKLLKSDVWAFGMLCWVAAHPGRSPYDWCEMTETIKLIQQAEPPPLAPPAAPRWLVDLANACWRRHPMDRPSFAELAERLG